MAKITVLGGGAMATACSALLAEHQGQQVSMWARNADYAKSMQQTRENARLLPGVKLSTSIEVTSDIAVAVSDAECYVVAIPTKFLRSALTTLQPHIQDRRPVISAVKGMEIGTLMRPSEIIRDVLGDRPVVAFGGPSHAEEIASRLPASVVAASDDASMAIRTQELFTTDRFRVYTNSDIVGVELAGALKNVIGIAAGICDGLKFGDNAKSALLTRGLVEIKRFGEALGAERATFNGLGGIGDLITTCTSPFGRNRAVGVRLGQGEKLDDIVNSMQAVAEGVTTAKSVHEVSRQHDIEMPITDAIHAVLFEGMNPRDAAASLMMRPVGGE